MAKKKTEAERDYDILISKYKNAMKDPNMRDVMWDILSFCDIYTDKFTGNSQTFMLLGKSKVGLFILERLQEADPTIYPNLLLDHGKDEQKDRHD